MCRCVLSPHAIHVHARLWQGLLPCEHTFTRFFSHASQLMRFDAFHASFSTLLAPSLRAERVLEAWRSRLRDVSERVRHRAFHSQPRTPLLSFASHTRRLVECSRRNKHTGVNCTTDDFVGRHALFTLSHMRFHELSAL